jgi:PAS domain S-box-containing protein
MLITPPAYSRIFLRTTLSICLSLYFCFQHTCAWCSPPDKIRLQLKWYHQFQFAGYYAAQTKGYYRDEGLEVELIEGSKDRPPDKMVLEHKADFGVHDGGDLVYLRLQGDPVVAIAAIFQHSPYAIISKSSSGIRHPSDLIGRTVMITQDQGSAQIVAMFRREGIKVKSALDQDPVRFVAHSRKLDDLIEGRVDAMSGYLTDMPNSLKQKGIEARVMRPLEYGIDYYGDTLFTSNEFLKASPDVVARFRRASLKGWEYAMAHPAEIAGMILALPTARPVKLNVQSLLAEADTMKDIVLPMLVETGNMNPGRWEKMAGIYQELGMVPSADRLKGFIYETDPDKQASKQWIKLLAFASGSISLLAIISLAWIRMLRSQVKVRTRELEDVSTFQRAILENASYAIISTNLDGVITSFNLAAEKLLGYSAEEVIGTQTPALFHLQEEVAARGEELAHFYKEPIEGFEVFVAPARRSARYERSWTYVRKDGSHLPVQLGISAMHDESGGITGFLGIAIDISEKLKVEAEQQHLKEQIHQNHKMDVLGHLAGGIAHDFNNMLAGIMASAELLKRRITEDDKNMKYVNTIINAAGRSAELTRELLAFSRKGQITFAPVSIHETIDSVIALLERTIDKNIIIETRLLAENPVVTGDAVLLQSALLNLAVNARDAMPLGGTLSFATTTVSLDANIELTHPFEITPGQFLELTLSDTGTGMTKGVIEHIFEPFYTTKSHGKGTGLGLSTVYGTIKNHHGAINIYSEPGMGTAFKVYLPTCCEDPHTADAFESVSGSGGILVVDDEAILRSVAQDLLEDLGYTVYVAEGGNQALEIYARKSGQIQLVLLDMIMPGLSGKETLLRLQELNPEVKVLFCSGFHHEGTNDELIQLGAQGFIRKPYLPTAMSKAIAEIINR